MWRGGGCEALLIRLALLSKQQAYVWLCGLTSRHFWFYLDRADSSQTGSSPPTVETGGLSSVICIWLSSTWASSMFHARPLILCVHKEGWFAAALSAVGCCLLVIVLHTSVREVPSHCVTVSHHCCPGHEYM